MALKPLRLTANVPAEVEECLAARVRELRYPSTSAYIVGLILFDLHSRRPHQLTAELMREPQWARDQVIAEIVAAFLAGEQKPGGWFEHRVEEIVAERTKREQNPELF